MTGGRELFACPKCGKKFFYWVQTNAQPKAKCSFCGTEFFPRGEPPAAPAPAPAPPSVQPVEPAPPAPEPPVN